MADSGLRHSKASLALIRAVAGSGLDMPHAPENGGDETLRLFFEKTRQAALSGADDVTLMTLARRKDAVWKASQPGRSQPGQAD